MRSRSSVGEQLAGRVLRDLQEMSAISASGQGVTRIAYTREDAAARLWFRERCERYGLRFNIDRVGNCYGWTHSAEGRRPLLIGSHLDSVIAGGAFDGTVGVMLGLEVARHFVEREPHLPLVAVSFACEESTRFGFGTVGSKWLVGDLGDELDDEIGAQLRDRDGLPLAVVLEEAGIPDLGPVERRSIKDFRGLVEVHIDQGTLLTSMGTGVAVVDTIAGVGRTEVVWVGESSHSGGRWREDRRDALVAASSFIVDANNWWKTVDEQGRKFQLTVGSLTIEPNSPNTVPGKAVAIVDTRSSDVQVLEMATAEIGNLARHAGERHRVDVGVSILGRSQPVQMDAEMRAHLARSADRLGVHAPRAPSLAGHDALVIARHIPTGMLLLANPTGISHAPAEALDEGALIDAAEILVTALPELL